MKPPENCPCGSGIEYIDCCGPYIQGERTAPTAEKLMRSRYTAFVLQKADYIVASWHEKSRPRGLNFDDHPVTWLDLTVHGCDGGGQDDKFGKVEFTSRYIEEGQLCSLRETSDFVKENGIWYYRRGECEVGKRKLERNRPCPCGSGKKFKRCCLFL